MSATIRLQQPTPVRGCHHDRDPRAAVTRPSRSGSPRAHRGVVERPDDRRRRAQRPVVAEATYRRRRMIVGTALAVFVAVGAVATHDVLAGSGSAPASAAVSQPARPMIVAQPGDTLWEIAHRYRGDISVMRYVDKLVSLNGGPSIVAGQTVVLP